MGGRRGPRRGFSRQGTWYNDRGANRRGEAVARLLELFETLIEWRLNTQSNARRQLRVHFDALAGIEFHHPSEAVARNGMQQTFGVSAMKNTDRILRLPEVETKSGLSRDTIYRGARENWFPRPIKISQGQAVGWIESEINAYLAARIAERDAS